MSKKDQIHDVKANRYMNCLETTWSGSPDCAVEINVFHLEIRVRIKGPEVLAHIYSFLTSALEDVPLKGRVTFRLVNINKWYK